MNWLKLGLMVACGVTVLISGDLAATKRRAETAEIRSQLSVIELQMCAVTGVEGRTPAPQRAIWVEERTARDSLNSQEFHSWHYACIANGRIVEYVWQSGAQFGASIDISFATPSRMYPTLDAAKKSVEETTAGHAIRCPDDAPPSTATPPGYYWTKSPPCDPRICSPAYGFYSYSRVGDERPLGWVSGGYSSWTAEKCPTKTDGSCTVEQLGAYVTLKDAQRALEQAWGTRKS